MQVKVQVKVHDVSLCFSVRDDQALSILSIDHSSGVTKGRYMSCPVLILLESKADFNQSSVFTLQHTSSI